MSKNIKNEKILRTYKASEESFKKKIVKDRIVNSIMIILTLSGGASLLLKYFGA